MSECDISQIPNSLLTLCLVSTSSPYIPINRIPKEKNIKTYPCKLCDYIASQKWLLKRHNLTHTGEKPYYCEFCDKNFRQLTHLNTHKCIPINEK